VKRRNGETAKRRRGSPIPRFPDSSSSTQHPTPNTQHPFSFPSSLYTIADTLGRSELSFTDLAEKFCAGGARLLQLRVKDLPSREFLAIAQDVRDICQRSGCLLIINDRADIALAVNSDGVHVGQEDLPLAAVRKVLGPRKLIGVSTHDPAQAVAAERGGADYIGFGPLFGTNTKATGYTVRGLDQLQQIRALVRLPIVAIGGITAERAASVLAAGADAVAMISDLMLADDVTTKVRETLEKIADKSVR
jgi:thiamine-phosphate pyrophosphorylase